MTDLERFYEAIMQAKKHSISRIYTHSKRATLALPVLNEFAAQYPDYALTIQTLAVLPVQVWAREMRSTVDLSLQDITSALNTGNMYLGFDDRTLLKQQKHILEVTDDAIDYLLTVLEDNTLGLDANEITVLRALHLPGEADTTNFLFHKYYETALEHMCEYIYKDMNNILEPIQLEVVDMEEEMKLAYHSAYLLLQMGKTLSKEENRRSSYADYEILYNEVENCICCLETYPFGGSDVYTVPKMIFEGKKEVRIAKETGKSRTYVRAKLREGSQALGMLIWGYATSAILDLN